MGTGRRQAADHRTRGDSGADLDEWDDWFVGGPARAGRDRDDAAAGDRAGIRDRAWSGGEHGLAGASGQVDAAVAGKPWFGGCFETADYLWRGLEWPGGRIGRERQGGDGQQGEVHAWEDAVVSGFRSPSIQDLWTTMPGSHCVRVVTYTSGGVP